MVIVAGEHQKNGLSTRGYCRLSAAKTENMRRWRLNLFIQVQMYIICTQNIKGDISALDPLSLRHFCWERARRRIRGKENVIFSHRPPPKRMLFNKLQPKENVSTLIISIFYPPFEFGRAAKMSLIRSSVGRIRFRHGAKSGKATLVGGAAELSSLAVHVVRSLGRSTNTGQTQPCVVRINIAIIKQIQFELSAVNFVCFTNIRLPLIWHNQPLGCCSASTDQPNVLDVAQPSDLSSVHKYCFICSCSAPRFRRAFVGWVVVGSVYGPNIQSTHYYLVQLFLFLRSCLPTSTYIIICQFNLCSRFNFGAPVPKHIHRIIMALPHAQQLEQRERERERE